MISNAKYRLNNKNYTDDKIISIKTDNKYQQKNLYHIIHNTENTEIKLLVEDYLLHAIYYTSDLTNRYYSYHNTCNNSTYDINHLSKFIKNLCNNPNVLYTVIITGTNIDIDNEKCNVQIVTEDYANNNINSIVNNEIEIVNSNILNIIDYRTSVNTDINIFSPGAIDFNNYLTFQYIGFNIINTVQLKHSKLTNIDKQIYAIFDYISFYTHNIDYKYYKKILLHTIFYEKKYNKNNSLLITLQYQLANIKLTQIKKMLDLNNPSDILFDIFLKCTTMNEKMNTDNIYKSNIIKNKDMIITCKEKLKTNKMLEESLDFYTSKITLETWEDIIQENKCFGILVNVKCPNSTKLGLTSDMTVNNYTNTLISEEMIIKGQKVFFDKFFTLDNGKYDHSLLMGGGIGKGNGILPIYINNKHWEIAKYYIEQCISLTISQNCYSFCKNMILVYYEVLMMILINCITTFTYNDFIIMINMLITIEKIEQIYDITIINNSDKVDFVDCTNINSILINYLMHGDDNSTFFANIYEENIRRKIYNFSKDKLKLFNEYERNRVNLYNQLIINDNINTIYKFTKMKKKLYQCKEFFLNNNGIINDELYNDFKSQLSTLDNYDYLLDIQKINNDFILDVSCNTIKDNLLLQSFITKDNKKRKQSFTHHYKDIILEPVNIIRENNSEILQHIIRVI